MIKNWLLITGLAIVVSSSAAIAQTAEGIQSGGASYTDRNIAYNILRTPVDVAEFQDQTFEEVLDWLRDQGPINVIAQWRALEAEGIGPDALISLELRDTTVADVLNEAIEQLSDVSPIQYRAQRNTLKISTKADFDRKMELRVYDVTDLLIRTKNFTSAPKIDIEQQSGGGGGAGGGSQQIFGGGGGSGGNDDDDEQDEDLDEDVPGITKLRELIEDTISRDSWDTYGGRGHVSPWDRTLIISASIEVHEQIAGRFIR